MPGIDAFVRPITSRRDDAEQGYAVLQRFSLLAAALSAPRLQTHLGYELTQQEPAALRAAEKLLVDELTARLAQVWERGWEPRDLLHVATKLSANSVWGLRRLILHQARLSGSELRAPEEWLGQLAAVRAEVGEVPHPWWPVRQSSNPVIGWTDHLLALKLLAELAPLEPVAPPPSRWDRVSHSRPAATAGSARERMLARVRGLLAKAESTDHPAEAEAFSAKAQELMTKHAIDEALLATDRHERVDVAARRFAIQAPYVSEKSMLLAAVGRANRCRVVRLAPYDLCTIVGTPVDVDQVELLFTSLLIQATRAMAEAGRRPGSFDRSKTFRRSFLAAYATRIGERLSEADAATAASYGADLVPVLQRQHDAVETEFERMFPRVVSGSSAHFDRRGWEAGQAAADRACFTAGRIGA